MLHACRVATSHRCFCISATTLSLPLFRRTSLRFCAACASSVKKIKDASAPPRIYGQRLELVEGASPRELPCHCLDKPSKPSRAAGGPRRCFVPSVSQRWRCLSLSSASPRSGYAQVQCHCSSSWRSVFVLWATTFKFCRRQRDFAAGNSSLMIFRV
jgi:hypothetical protein